MSVMTKIGLERINAAMMKNWGRCGLLCNQASVDAHFTHAITILAHLLGPRLTALFSPQHGLDGDVQDNMIETPHGRHVETGLPIFSLYSETRRPTPEMFTILDTLIVDLQTVGCRVYTFKATLLECMRVAKQTGKKIVILDRPNPVGGLHVEGPVLDSHLISFVGPAQIPLRHGLTVGEMGRFFNRDVGAELDVVTLDGWDSTEDWRTTQRPWVITSPNLPTLDAVFVYPGTVIFEGTNISEGRGTSLPFLFVGAPYVGRSSDLVERVKDDLKDDLRGVHLRPVLFRPTSGKWANTDCRGVQIHVLDPKRQPMLSLALALLRGFIEFGGDQFQWKQPPYEYEHTILPIQLLLGIQAAERCAQVWGPRDSRWSAGLDEYIRAANAALLYERHLQAL